jgi:high-affinity iron transporter
MLPTFVIGLREGLEAALIVGIVAAFLRQRGRLDLLRWAFVGVAAALALCVAVGVVLEVISHELPQRQQEGLETVIGACAVAMVTYMVVWMRRNARTLKAQLEGAAGEALAAGSGFALVLMAFLAVLREGLETVVFLLAAFNQSGSTSLAATGAVLGILVAVALGWAIYRGGVRLNLARFFRFTGIVLTFVAAGLVVSALHTAHEAGWLTIGQQSTVDLSALVRPGSVQAALLTGMLGVQSQPVLIEVIGWLVYLVPVGLYIALPPRSSAVPAQWRSSVALRRTLAGLGATAVLAAIALAILTPGRPAPDATTTGGGLSARLVSADADADAALISATVIRPVEGTSLAGQQLQVRTDPSGANGTAGVASVERYTVTVTAPVTGGPSTVTYAEIAARNGGRLPLGVRAGDGTETVAVSSESVDTGTFSVDSRTGRVVDVQWRETVTEKATLPIGPTVVGTPSTAVWQLPEASAAAARSQAAADRHTLDRHSLMGALALVAWLLAGLCAVLIAGLALISRRGGGVGAEVDPNVAVSDSAVVAGASAPGGTVAGKPVPPRSELVKS